MDPEVLKNSVRRQYPAAYKLQILEKADACAQHGELAALLRREGLYSSHLTTWRKQREEGILSGLKPRKRGRKARPQEPIIKYAINLCWIKRPLTSLLVDGNANQPQSAGERHAAISDIDHDRPPLARRPVARQGRICGGWIDLEIIEVVSCL